MVFCELNEFFTSHGIAMCVLSVAVCVVTETVSFAFKGKLPPVFNYLPFVLGIIAQSVFLLIKGEWTIESALGLGLVCGSLSEIWSAILFRIKTKRPVCDNAAILLIEGIIKDFLPEEAVENTAKEIYSVLNTNDAAKKIANILSVHLDKGVNALDLATLIITSVFSIREK